jgi:tetratricopeptide (TPR) repeat protein
MPERLRPHLPWIAVLLATAAAYSAVATFQFAYDDDLVIVHNEWIRSWHFLPQYFTHHVFAYNRTLLPRYYRPMFLIWLRLGYWFFVLRPAGWHLFNLALHLVATGLLYAIARLLTRDSRIAFGSAIVFGLHPAHTESVAWINGAPDPLAAVFLFLALWLYLRDLERPSTLNYLLGLIAFIAALLSKELAVALPALVLLWVWLRRAEIPFEQRRRSFVLVATQVLLTLIFLGVRRFVLGSAPAANRHTARAIHIVLLSQPSLLWFYAKKLFWPVHLSESYPYQPVRFFDVSHVLLPALFVLAILVAGFLLLRVLTLNTTLRAVAIFGVAFGLLPLLPVLDLAALPAGDWVHQRYLYLPLAGFALLFATLGVEVADRLHLSAKAAALVALCLAAGLAIVTVHEASFWKNDETLYRRALESDPNNFIFRTNLASYFIDQQRIPEAISELQAALAQAPRHRAAWVNLAIAYELRGDPRSARNAWQTAESIQPDPEIESNLDRLNQLLAPSP